MSCSCGTGRELLDSGVKALVLVPHDADKAGAHLRAAKAKQVPGICFTSACPRSDVALLHRRGRLEQKIGLLSSRFLSQQAPKETTF